MAHTHTHPHNGAESEVHPKRQDASHEASEGPENRNKRNSAQDDTMRRAEELADRIGERVGHYASVASLGVMRFAARAREEMEDMWAEAQHIRRGGKT
jgi:hypothetical protein